MKNADVAAKLRALAIRVRGNIPRRRDPERFHVEISEIVNDLHRLAAEIELDAGDYAAVPKPPRLSGTRVVIGHTVINGRRVTVQRRMPFAIAAK